MQFAAPISVRYLVSRILVPQSVPLRYSAIRFLAADVIQDIHDEVFDDEVVRVPLIGLVRYVMLLFSTIC